MAITAAEGAARTGRHRLLKGGSEGFSGALDRLVGHCSTYATYGGWESAQKAQDVTDAANDLGVDVTNCQNRKETAIALVAAGCGLILIIISTKGKKQQATRTAVGSWVFMGCLTSLRTRCLLSIEWGLCRRLGYFPSV